MNWFVELLNTIWPQFQKWYDFFGELGYTEEQKRQLAYWSEKIPPVIAAALLSFFKKWYEENGQEKTKELIDKITDVVDELL